MNACVIELTESTIRLCRVVDDKVSALEAFPVPADGDPIAALAAAPLPRPLGSVRLVFRHDDMLLKSMLQPPMPRERLDHIVRFEMQSTGDLNTMLMTWQIAATGGTGDMRLLIMLAKKDLVERLREALSHHGARLSSLVHPAIGLYHGWRAQAPGNQENAVLVDCGGANINLTMVQNGELLFFRSHAPGMNQLTDDIAELRGIDPKDARQLQRKLGAGAPDDLVELVRRHAGNLASTINNTLRFTRAQLQLERFETEAVYLSGAGARLPAFAETIAERTGMRTRLINPFAFRGSRLATEDLDKIAELPSPWTVALGVAQPEQLDLDVMQQIRAERSAFWQTSGALRAALVACAALVLLAFLVQGMRIAVQESAIEQLAGENGDDGLVPQAEQADQALDGELDEFAAMRQRMHFLDNERRPARLSTEVLNAIARIQDPETTPIYLRGFRLQRPGPGSLQLELEGYAIDAKQRTKAEVINGFRAELCEQYPLIKQSAISELRVPVQEQRQNFHWLIDL